MVSLISKVYKNDLPPQKIQLHQRRFFVEVILLLYGKIEQI